MKRTGICLLLMLLLLTGCGQQSAFDGSRMTNETGFMMDYAALNREEIAALELEKGDTLRVELSHTGGKVDVKIGREGEEPIYQGTAQENAAFDLVIPEEGSYQISVTGHRARGKASFMRIPAEEQAAAK
jgi:hypothetical protein